MVLAGQIFQQGLGGFRRNVLTVPFLQKKDLPVQVSYISGLDPWSLWLRLLEDEEVYKHLLDRAKELYDRGELVQVPEPAEGMHVLARDHDMVFRGVVIFLSPNKRCARVQNVDNGSEKFLPFKNLFKMRLDLCNPQARAIHCALKSGDEEPWWSLGEFSKTFIGFLQNYKLTIEIIDQHNEMVPKYIVELHAYNERSEVSLSAWFNDWLLPEVESVGKNNILSCDMALKLIDNNVLNIWKYFRFLSVSWPKAGGKGTQELHYMSGQNPWCFWLGHGSSPELERVTAHLRELFVKQQLPLLREMKDGQFAVGFDNGELFRCLVLKVTRDKLCVKVVNIDKGSEMFLSGENVYEMPPELYRVPSNAFCCTLIEGPHEVWWDEGEFGPEFVRTLKNSRISVQINKVLEGLPPKFVVDVYISQDDLEFVSLNMWLKFYLLPTVNSTRGGPAAMSSFLDPYEFHRSQALSYCSSSRGDETEVASVSSYLESSFQELSCRENTSTPDSEETITAVSEGLALNGEHGIISHDMGTLQNSMNWVEGGLLERSAVPYMPQDDKVICHVYSTTGTCWKKGCRLFHPPKYNSLKWTNDEVPIYNSILNDINLPLIGSQEKVTVCHVVSPNTFYVHLPGSYADFECESLESLEAMLNKTAVVQTLKFISSPLAFSELIIAYSKSLERWLRAYVDDVYDENMIVAYFVDHGFKEEVKTSKCREILPQFIHLPAQAVYCCLDRLWVVEEQEEAGIKFLRSQIFEKEIEIIVKDIIEENLQVNAFTINGLDLNDVMVKNGFCEIKSRNIHS